MNALEPLLTSEIIFGGGSKAPGPTNTVIFVSGTRGEVQPFIALGLHLKSLGHAVFIATEQRMKGFVEEYGLTHRCIGGDPSGYLFEPGAQQALANASLLQLISLTEAWDKKYPKSEILSTYEACGEGADLIIGAALTLTPSFCIAEKLNVPCVPVILGPTLPTSEFPIWPLESIAICSCLNKWTYNMAFKALWNSESKFINPWRKESLGLPEITSPRGLVDIFDTLRLPIIIACSKKIIGYKGEVPADYPFNAHFTGFFFVPPTDPLTIDPALAEFMENNPENRKTVYLGFGSMPAANPKGLLEVAVAACSEVGCRAVIAAGWTDLDGEEYRQILNPAEEMGMVLIVKAAPHDWLLQRCDCIVHHSGLGTMAASLRSGRPQIPCPVMLDQPYNSRTSQRLGCALDVIPFKQLTSTKLIAALRRVFADENDVVQMAQGMQQEVEDESRNALDLATEIILDYAKKFREN